MPLITERNAVAGILDEARLEKWVIPAFGVENLTNMEAVLAAACEQAQKIGRADLPIMLAVTNNYAPRRQSAFYTHSRQWQIGLRLFMAEARALAGEYSPYAGLRIMLHLDHALHDQDAELFTWDLTQFSSIMFDASTLPLEQNIAATRSFVEQHGNEIVIEGACDEVGHSSAPVSDPAVVERYWRETGVDLVVANLGTEHRADSAALTYEGASARGMAARIGSRLVLHGTSSVRSDVLGRLAADGICKGNVWTAFERDSAGVLLEAMAKNASKIAGKEMAGGLLGQGLLGEAAELTSPLNLDFFPTAWRQQIVFEEMKKIAGVYLRAWFPA